MLLNFRVVSDLRRCLAECEVHRAIDQFPLCTRDVADQLMIPERLYRRERATDQLLSSYERDSRKEQNLSKAAAAIYVIDQAAIRRSGATNIPDLLRGVPGVDVAQNG
jgi:outer membrane receptor for ferrienterochelin and colicin